MVRSGQPQKLSVLFENNTATSLFTLCLLSKKVCLCAGTDWLSSSVSHRMARGQVFEHTGLNKYNKNYFDQMHTVLDTTTTQEVNSRQDTDIQIDPPTPLDKRSKPHQVTSRQETDIQIDPSTPLDKRSEPHKVSSNSWFDLHSPKPLHCCLPKQ